MTRVLAPATAALGVLQLLQGAVMVVAPRWFYDTIGPFGPYNEHYVRDVATWSLALGVTLLLAARWAAWRVPILGFAALQFGLHTINHFVDVGAASTTAIGVFDAVTLAGLTLLLLAMLRAAAADREVSTR